MISHSVMNGEMVLLVEVRLQVGDGEARGESAQATAKSRSVLAQLNFQELPVVGQRAVRAQGVQAGQNFVGRALDIIHYMSNVIFELIIISTTYAKDHSHIHTQPSGQTFQSKRAK